MAENTANILAIELLAAAQGVDLRGPYPTSPRLREVMALLRAHVAHYDLDHYFAPDIAVAAGLVQRAEIAAHAPLAFESQQAA